MYSHRYKEGLRTVLTCNYVNTYEYTHRTLLGHMHPGPLRHLAYEYIHVFTVDSQPPSVERIINNSPHNEPKTKLAQSWTHRLTVATLATKGTAPAPAAGRGRCARGGGEGGGAVRCGRRAARKQRKTNKHAVNCRLTPHVTSRRCVPQTRPHRERGREGSHICIRAANVPGYSHTHSHTLASTLIRERPWKAVGKVFGKNFH